MSSEIKVLNVQPDDIVMGGVQVRTIDVAKGLEKYGIQTDIMVARNPDTPDDGPVSQAARKEGLRVFKYRGLHRPRRFRNVESLIHNLKWLFTLPKAVRRAGNVIQKSDADVVHVNGLLNLVPAIAARWAGKKLVWSLIGDHYPWTLVAVLRPLLKLLPQRRVLLAESMKKYYFGSADYDRSIVIQEPVKLNRFYSDNSADELLFEEFDIEPSKTIIGGVGNIVPSKGWLYFLEAADKIVEKCSDVHFIITGAESQTQREYAEEVKHNINELGLQEYVTLTGYRNDVEDVLAMIDIFMLASLNEGTPIAILEAMATGLPVIATDVGGVSDQIIDGKTGFLVSSEDPSALARACQRLISNPGLRKKMGNRGRDHVEKNYSLEACVSSHREMYKDVALSSTLPIRAHGT